MYVTGISSVADGTSAAGRRSMPVTRIPAAAKIGQTGPDPHPMSRIDAAA